MSAKNGLTFNVEATDQTGVKNPYFEIYVDGVQQKGYANGWTLPVDIPDGKIMIKVVLTDTVGAGANKNTYNFTFTVDSTAPTLENVIGSEIGNERSCFIRIRYVYDEFSGAAPASNLC